MAVTTTSDVNNRSKNGIFSNFKEKHPKATKAIVTTGKVVAGVVVAVAAITAAYVVFNNPSVGKNCSRAHFNKFGNPKVGYKSPQRANFQVVKDVMLHKTIMHPYKCRTCGDYHVGHKH